MFKFFKKQHQINKGNKARNTQTYAVCLMIEVARMDGIVKPEEINEIKKRVQKLLPSEDANSVFERMLEISKEETSMHPFIKQINADFDQQAKINLMEDIWLLIKSDNEIDPYEESLFYKIGDLLKIRRSLLNQIKSKV